MLAFYRIYFDANSGEPLATAWAKGDIRVPTQEEDYAKLPGLAGRTEADTICWEQLTEERIALCHQNGIVVNAWTVDDPGAGEKLAAWGIDYITSNILE